MSKLFTEGTRVALLEGTIGVADEQDDESLVPAGAEGKVVCVRECGAPDGPQGAWLYDVEVTHDGKLFWLIYDAEDAHHLRVRGVPRADLSNLRMVAGGEGRLSIVIDGNIVKEWVGIGWIPLREATDEDREKYPAILD